jgi:hypothetical protein
VSSVDANTVSIYIDGDLPADGDVDELIRVMDEAGLDAIVGPVPGRMGLVPDLPALIVETPFSVLATFLVTVAGQRAWRILTRIAGRWGSGPHDTGSEAAGDTGQLPADDAGPVAVVIHDTERRIRLDLTLNDLADPALQQQLTRLGTLAGHPTQVVLRWDGPEGWRVQDPDAR